MAASRRSPLIRDQWKVEDRDPDGRYGREARNPRASSPARSQHRETGDIGLAIKGRATLHHAERRPSSHHRHRSSSGRRDPPRRETDFRDARRRGRERSEEPPADARARGPDQSPPVHRRSQRQRSIGHEAGPHHREHRRRERSPRYVDRRPSPASRRREAPRSPRYPSREENFAASRDYLDIYHDRAARDSYIPTSRRERSRSPTTTQYRPEPPRRRASLERHRSHHEGRSYRRREEGHREGYRRRPSLGSRSRPPRSRETSPSGHPRPPRYSDEQKRRNPDGGSHPNAKALEPSRRRSGSRSSSDRGYRPDDRMMQSTQPIQSILDDPRRQPSPPRPIPGYDHAGHGGDAHGYGMQGMRPGDIRSGHGHVPIHINTRQPYAASPQYVTPTSSRHGSPPHPASPYSSSQGHGGWGAQTPQYMGQPGQPANAYSPPFRQNSYPPAGGQHGQYHQQQQHAYPGHHQQTQQQGYQSPSYRGGHGGGGMRGNHFPHHQDRRFSGGSAGTPHYTPPAPRGRGHFQNLQWTASGGTRGGKQTESHGAAAHQRALSQNSPAAPADQSAAEESTPVDENPFRPSKAFQVEDEGSIDLQMPDVPPVPQPAQPAPESPRQSKESSKVKFAFKTKPALSSAARLPVPDLSQKMKEPPSMVRKDAAADEDDEADEEEEGQRDRHRNALSAPDPNAARYRPGHRSDHRDERRDARVDRWDDRRAKDSEHRYREDRKPEREYRDDRRGDVRAERRAERERERERERSPELQKVRKLMKRIKQRPTLAADFAASDSVYYRKPGNESVVGSGTYGKVFKAIHVYTKRLVALKKIRMEGEKDGFPVTAVREIKLLQSLRHERVVSLYEVMVEKNDCFMVFEYLSHDLTGLLNHPTFRLEHSHKKHLAKQLFEALDHLHRRGVLHRDIKAANILVSNTGQLKLADFGLARFYAKRRQLDYTNRVITIWYRPPELLLGETQYGPAVDIWSAACVLVEIFTKHAIFPGDGGEINQLEKVYNVLGTPTTSEWPGLVDMAWFELLRPSERKPSTFAEKYRERLTPAAFELLRAMFLYDPVKRPTAAEVLEHPYFTTEEPAPAQAVELKDLQGDWHEFESKALRRENERKDKEARRAARQEDQERERAKRRASASMVASERDTKRVRPSPNHEDVEVR